MLFMVIGRCKSRDSEEVYRRFQEKGGLMPEGLRCIDSWIDASFGRCFQLMECDDVRLFREWILQWQDLVEFEVVPVTPSKEMTEIIARTL